MEPIDSPLTDYSGDNTNDTDIAVLDVISDKKYARSPESPPNTNKTSSTNVCSDHSVKKCINEVSSTQPCLNIVSEKNLEPDEEKEIEIDKEVETVLQSGTIVESLSITTENINFVSSEAHSVKGNFLSVTFFYYLWLVNKSYILYACIKYYFI